MRLCIDLGATNVKGALIENAIIRKAAKTPTDHSHGRDGIVSSLQHTIDALMCPEVEAICIGSAGDIDVASRRCTYATGNLEDFTGFDFAAFVKEKYDLPCYAANDAYCALLGEMYFGAGKAYKDRRVVMLTLGSGVGGGYWDGATLRQEASNGEGKLGHLTLHEGGTPCNCGKVGCIEQYLSGRAINRLSRERGLADDSLFEELRAHNGVAYMAAEQVARELALAAEVIQKRCPFDVLMLGGGVAESIDDLTWLQVRVGCKLALASLGNRAGLLGAYALAETERSTSIER